jgi:hypothetical protein
MKLFFIFILHFSFISCETKLRVGELINIDSVNELFIQKGYPEKNISIKKSKIKNLIDDLNNLKKIEGPIKYAKQYKIILKYKNEDIDTIFTNGEIFRLKNDYYKSKHNLFKKHNIN